MVRKIVSSYAIFENLGGTRDMVFYYEGGGAGTVNGVAAAEADYLVSLLRNEKPVSYDSALKRLSTPSPEPVGKAERGVDLDAWLASRPAVAASIVWEDAGGARAWSTWSTGEKAELWQAFDLARDRSSIPVAEVPPNQAVLADDQQVITILAAADAWAYYKASVAQSLAVEIGQQVPWSLQGYSTNQLAQLFDSREMFVWNAAPAGYRIDSAHGHLVPGPPSHSYEFLGSAGLIAGSRLDTLANVIDWCRANLVHFSGSTTAANMQDQWQYRGWPPMTRVLAGTVLSAQPALGSMHRTAGCWGTTGFLRALLRVINIPVKLVSNAGHAQPWFMADARYLSHGDDPYNQLTRAVPPIPPDQILIDQATFDSWFGAGVSAADKASNIGRRTRELAISYLPNYLLHAYCHDQGAGVGHGAGQVFDVFSGNYTLAQLEADDLWTRMDAKIAGFGGCPHVP